VATDTPLPLPVAADPRFHGLVPPTARLERLMTGATWAEGPVWLPDDGSVVWSDVPNDRLFRWSPAGDSGVLEAGAGFQNGHALDLDGRLLACEQGERRISRRTATGARQTVVDSIDGRRLNSPNDVVVKSDGSIWFSDPPYGIVSDWEGHRADPELDGNFVFRFDPATGTIEVVTTVIEEPNGLAFSPDESVLYVSDTSAVLRRDGSGNHHIVAFDVIAGRTLANPRIFAVVAPGVPDGFAVDVHGNVFTSAGDGVHVLSPAGRRLGTIPVPERVGNCTFGGVDGDRLFITASTSLYAISLTTRGAGLPRR
jgi:gluconolactonase